MCIGLWTLEHPNYALILGTNRDEYLDRPTENAHFHSFETKTGGVPESVSVLSGRDIQGGGSWFGINRAGRVALLTNITESPAKYSTSRGSLVSSFLLSQASIPLNGTEIWKVVSKDADYAGFNMLLLEPTFDDRNGSQSVCYQSLLLTNHGGGGVLTARPLTSHERTCGCISNGIDGKGANLWPKVIQASSDLDTLLHALTSETSETELVECLFDLLTWHPEVMITNREDVQSSIQVIPVPVVLDGSAGTHQPTYYGTRLSTVLLVHKNGEVLFIERDMWELGRDELPFKPDPPTERRFRFRMDGNKKVNSMGMNV